MQKDKESFLDSTTLIAITLLLFSWWGWDYYMKKKYPPQKKTEILETENTKELKKPSPLISESVKPDSYKEQTFEFKGENLEVVFSSKGFGIRQFKLNNYYNRQKEPIFFDYFDKPLFANFFFQNEEDFIPFEIRKEGDLFLGEYFFPQGVVKKTIAVDDKNFILDVNIEIPKNQDFKGLSLFFSHPVSEEDQKSSLLKFLFIYGQDITKAFVFFDGSQKERFLAKELESLRSYQRLSLAALGGKYFGSAFINRSSFLPSVEFYNGSKHIHARIDYEFLSSKKQTLSYRLFLGPKSLRNFNALGGEIRQWLDFGFFGWLARPLLLFLNWLYGLSGNWGLSIIFLTLFVRLCLFPINIKSYQSMKGMQKIQPQIKELKETHKSDPKKLNLEIMALMKQNKVNPLGGCLPLFIQFPVFFALYRVLGESIELYQSPFILWIEDLSLKDPYFILPVLGGGVLFVQQKLTPMNLPKEQARLLAFMPIVFSVFMLGLPSGLTLYIFVSGLFGLAQQLFFVKLGHKGG